MGFTIEFTDGGPAVSCVLGFNTRERCQDAAMNLPGRVPYTGPRPPLGATFFACPTDTLTPA